MRKIAFALLGALLALAGATPAWSQCQSYTQVTGTITDASGIPYAGGRITADLFPSGGTPTCTPASGGTNPQFAAHIAAALDSSGSFAIQLPPNSIIQPGGTQWNFSVTISPGVPLPFGTGPQQFSVKATISGSTQSLTSALSAAAPALTLPLTGSGSVKVNGVAIPNANLQDSGSYFFQVVGSNIQMMPQDAVLSPVGIVNGNFEAPNFTGSGPIPPVGWSNLGADTGSQSYDTTNPAPNKTFSLKMTCNANSTQCVMFNDTFFTLIPGQTYTVNGYERSDGTAPAAICLLFDQGGNSSVNDVSVCSHTLSTSWTFVTVTLTATAGQDVGLVILADTPNDTGSGATNNPVAGTMHFDDIQLYHNTDYSFRDVQEIAAPANPASGFERWFANSSSHLLTCLTSSGGNCAPSGTSAFSALTGGTNTTAAMVIGTGASLTVSGSGTINATTLGGATFAAPGAIGGGTASSGAFTTLSASGTFTSNISGGGTQCVQASNTGVLTGTGSGCGTINAAPQFAIANYSASGSGTSISGIAGPTSPNGVPQTLACTPSVGVATQCVFALGGVPIDATNPATLLVTDRANYLKWSSGTALALPAVASSFASNLPFVLQNIEGATLTITPNAGASDLIDGAASGTLLNNFAAFVYQDSTTAPGHWFTIKVPTFAAFGSTCANVITWSTTAGVTCIQVNLASMVTGQLPIGAVGSAGLSATAPVTIAATGVIACATCNTSAAVANPPFDKSATGLSNPTADSTFTQPAASTTGWTLAGTAPASVSTSTGTNATSLFNVNGVIGGADSNATGTAGVGSSPTITAGAGGAGTGTNTVGGAGGAITLTGGAGGASAGTGANSNGGNIVALPGAAGTGGSGTAGKPGVFQVGSSAPFPISGTAGGAIAVEGTAFTGISGDDGWYSNATNHCFDLINQTTDVGCAVAVGQANTAAAAMTLDMSAATGATAFKVPVIAGATAGANGVIDYDSTNDATHVRTDNVDSTAAGTVAVIDLTGQTAAKTATALYTPTITRRLLITGYLKVTTAATTSSILGGTTGIVIVYTDGTDSVAQSVTLACSSQAGNTITVATGNTGNTTTTVSQCNAVLFAKAAGAMTYAIGYTSVGGTAMAYEAHLSVIAP